MTRAAGWVVGLLGVLACSPVLGIGEASLQCDTDPCTTAVPSAAGSARSLDAGTARGGAGGANGVETPAPVTSRTESEVSGGGVAPSFAPATEEGPAPGGAASSGPAPAPEDSGAPEGSGGPEGSGAPEGAEAFCSSSGDACGNCLCDRCAVEVDRCSATQGCFEIVACARLNGCVDFACFCGSVDPIACATGGRADGPCVDTTLAAPSSRSPTLANPSAGPASDAALALSSCTGQSCGACRN
jgi:hypothetical protein